MHVKWIRDKQHWEVKPINDEDQHNHSLDKAAIFYTQHRKITATVKQQITSMSNNAIKPQKIFQEVMNCDDEPIIKKKDLYNFCAMIYEEDKYGRFSRIFEYFMDTDYATRYKPNATKMKLNALFMMHEASIPKAHRFNEIIALDATYKSNKNDMPLLDVVGVSHLGSSKLQSVLIAPTFVINEKEESYSWVLKTVRNIIWPDGDVGIFISNNDLAVINAIKNHFPNSKHILCGWHMEQHLCNNIGACFPPKSEEMQEVKKLIKDMIYINKENEDTFNTAVDYYKSLIQKGALSYARENHRPKKSKENNKKTKQKTRAYYTRTLSV